MTALHELAINIPDARKDWTNEKYFESMQTHLGLALVVTSDLIDDGLLFSQDDQGGFDKEDVARQNIGKAVLLGVEVARRNGWSLHEKFSAAVQQGKEGDLIHAVLKANGYISAAYFDGYNNTVPVGALNLALSNLVSLCRYKEWKIEEWVVENMSKSKNGHE